MPQAKQGDTVRLHCTGKLKGGEIFDSSRQRQPLELTLGGGQIITGLERAIQGMAPGQAKTVDVAAADAFGPRNDDMILQFDRSKLPADVTPQIGQHLQLETQEGHSVPAVVAGVNETTVTVDANHPLAGKDLTFDLELLEIV